MLDILSITSPVFILIGVGYLCVMSGLVNQNATRGMGTFVVTIALPALIIRGMVNSPLESSMNLDFLFGYGAASLALFVIGTVVYRLIRKSNLAEASMTGLGISSANTGFIGASICTMMLGADVASRGVAMTIIVESLVVIPLSMAIADTVNQQGETRIFQRLIYTAKGMIRSPLLIAISIGLFLSGFQVPVPTVAVRVIDMLALAAAPVSLFAVGGNLYGLRPKGMLKDAASISLVKLIIHPALTAAVFMLLPGLDPLMRQTGILYAAAPMLSIYPIIGMRYGLEDRCSATLLLGMVLSFFTISATIALIS